MKLRVSSVNSCPPELDENDQLILYPIGCCMVAASKFAELGRIQTGKLYCYTMVSTSPLKEKLSKVVLPKSELTSTPLPSPPYFRTERDIWHDTWETCNLDNTSIFISERHPYISTQSRKGLQQENPATWPGTLHILRMSASTLPQPVK